MLTVKLRSAYYFGVNGKCNFFVAAGIAVDFGGRCRVAGLARRLRMTYGQIMEAHPHEQASHCARRSCKPRLPSSQIRLAGRR
jgi:hypothetical protein